ncbi:hypothetical protein M885DRAFT_438904, partial [Pelagophyceae sp. CCMP2097]
MGDSGQARTCGMLLKKGGSKGLRLSLTGVAHRRNWQRRWFQLDIEHGELRYYRDATLAKHKGTVRLDATSVIKVPDVVELRGRHRPKLDEELNYFELHGVCDHEGHLRPRPFSMRAAKGNELLEWLHALKL